MSFKGTRGALCLASRAYSPAGCLPPPLSPAAARPGSLRGAGTEQGLTPPHARTGGLVGQQALGLKLLSGFPS